MDQQGLLHKLTQPIAKAIGSVIGASTYFPDLESEVLPDWLQAVSYLFDDELFYLASGGLGFGFIGPPLSGVDEQGAEKLQVLLQNAFPKNTLIQFMLWSGPDLEAPLTSYMGDRPNVPDPMLREMRDERITFLRDGAETSLTEGSDIRLRNTQLIVTVRMPSGVDPSPKDIIAAKELREVFKHGMAACGLRLATLTPPRYLRLMQTIFNWGPEAAWRASPTTEYCPDLLLTEQILDAHNAIEVDEKGLWVGKQRVRVISPKRYPKEAIFGEAYQFLGDPMTGSRGLRDPTLITANIWYGDGETDRASLQREAMFMTHQSSKHLTKFKPAIMDQKKALDITVAALDGGDRIIRMHFGMAVFASTENRSVAASQNARVYMREFGFQMMEDHFAVAPIFASLLPWAADPASEVGLRRFRRFAVQHVVPLLPIMSEWRGTGSPLIVAASRNGQLMTISNWDSESNYNAIIAAESGSGKSFLMNDVICAERQMGSRVWVIDKGKSYRYLNEAQSGERLQFGDDSNLCLNPFSLIEDYADDEDILFGLISAMAAVRDPLTNIQVSRLKQVMRDCWDDLGKGMQIDDLAKALLKVTDDQRVQDIGHQLFPFTARGTYGRWFNGTNNYRADNPFVLLELDELDGRQHLQRIVLLQLIFQIKREMNRGDRGQKKILVIDEAWELLRGDEIAPFIEAAYRQFRKLNGAAWTITQSCTDFMQSAATRAIYENSAHKWLLGQRGESINMVQKENFLALGDHGFSMLRSVHTVRGQYSEIFFHTPYGYGVGRLVVPKFSRNLYSTTPADVARMEQFRKQGMSAVEAARYLMQERDGQGAIKGNDQRLIA